MDTKTARDRDMYHTIILMRQVSSADGPTRDTMRQEDAVGTMRRSVLSGAIDYFEKLDDPSRQRFSSWVHDNNILRPDGGLNPDRRLAPNYCITGPS
jgi:hypothetical protein